MTKKNNGRRIKINKDKQEARLVNEYKNKEFYGCNEDIHKIIEICKEHKFYTGWIVGKLKQMKHNKSIHYILRDWGFMIYADYDAGKTIVLVEFLFVLPEFRRQGVATKLINILKNKDAILLTIDLDNEGMMEFVKKQGFRRIARCRSGNEDLWSWSDKYDDEFIKKHLY